jgi:O-methyltransferase involved in polyketide biosynthesis
VGTMPDKTKPTLWLAECVLCYLQPEVADGVVKWFEEECEGWVGGVVYEMFGLR